MIRIVIALTISLIGLICQAQVSENRTIAPFTTLEASTGVEVHYTQGKTTSLKVISDDAEKIGQISTEVNNGVLRISVKPKKGNNNFKILRVEVTNPNTTVFKIASGAKLMADTVLENSGTKISLSSGARFKGAVKSPKVQLSVHSGAVFNGTIHAAEVDAALSGGSRAVLSGKADTVTFDVKSASVCEADDLNVKNATVEAANASEVTVKASESLDASASSVASIVYYGSPKKITTHKNALGTITAK